MRWTDIILGFGIIIMFYGLYNAFLVYKILSNKKCWFSFGGKVKRIWFIFLNLIIFFLLGYIIYFINSFVIHKISPDTLISLMFFFGSIFVLMNTKSNYEVYSKLIKKLKK